MGSIYTRGNTLWIAFLEADGKRRLVSSGLQVGSESKAHKLLEELERKVATGFVPMAETENETVNQYLDRWASRRHSAGMSDATHERQRLLIHAKTILQLAMVDVKPRHIRDIVMALRGRVGQTSASLAPRTVRKVYGSLHSMFES
jgi:hypothetical protein